MCILHITYHEQGLAFAPLAANAFGQLGSSASSGPSLIIQPGIMFQFLSPYSQSCQTLHPPMIITFITLLRLFAPQVARSGPTLWGVPFAPAHGCLRSRYPSRPRPHLALAESGPVLGDPEPSLFALVSGEQRVSSTTALLATSGCPGGRHSLCPWSGLPLPFAPPSPLEQSQPCQHSPICSGSGVEVSGAEMAGVPPAVPFRHQPPTFAVPSPPPRASLQLATLAGDCSSVDGRPPSPRLSPAIAPLRVPPPPHSSPVLSLPSFLTSPPLILCACGCQCFPVFLVALNFHLYT
jgi:hypothetical protein